MAVKKAYDNWGVFLINKVIHPFVMVVPPVFLVVLMVLFLVKAFGLGAQPGIRSLAGALLPIIIVTFIYVFRRDLLASLGRIPTLVSFLCAMATGILTLALIRGFAYSSGMPVIQVMLSGCMSILVFSYVTFEGAKMLSYYFGMIVGFLLYIIIFGSPVPI